MIQHSVAAWEGSLRTHRLVSAALLVLLAGFALSSAVAQAQDQAVGTKTWIGRYEELEEFLENAEVIGMEDIGVGVTGPEWCYLAPGGPIEAFAWKPLRPGIYRGYYESYKAEIAAYELDKLLGLDMVPVKVERQIRGDLGAAIMRVENVQSFADLGGVPDAPNSHIGMWNLQLIRAKMFQNLIYDKDNNEGNWLVDPDWNIILIDHSRAFTAEKKMQNQLTRADINLWEKMQQLDKATLTAALGEWLNEREIRAILECRAEMEREIAKLVEDRGEEDVFVR